MIRSGKYVRIGVLSLFNLGILLNLDILIPVTVRYKLYSNSRINIER